MKLDNYIAVWHNGNTSAFARSQGVQQSQAARWLTRNCMVIDGVVYCQVSKHKFVVSPNDSLSTDNCTITKTTNTDFYNKESNDWSNK